MKTRRRLSSFLRAHQLVKLYTDEKHGSAILVGPRQIGERVLDLKLAEADTRKLRLMLESEFRTVSSESSEATLRRAAKRLRVLAHESSGESCSFLSGVAAYQAIEKMVPSRTKRDGVKTQ